jgi:hypothetical protein
MPGEVICSPVFRASLAAESSVALSVAWPTTRGFQPLAGPRSYLSLNALKVLSLLPPPTKPIIAAAAKK